MSFATNFLFQVGIAIEKALLFAGRGLNWLRKMN
jgi:hypothetical protein